MPGGGPGPTQDTWFQGPTPVHIPKRHRDQFGRFLLVYVRLTVMTNRRTDKHTQAHGESTPRYIYSNRSHFLLSTKCGLVPVHPFSGLFFRTTWVNRYQKGKTNLDLNEATDDGLLGCGGISSTICKQPAPRSRQITAPTPHHSIFTGRMVFQTPSQQCRSTENTNVARWINKIVYCYYVTVCLQRFDAVGWAAGRASGL